MQIKCDSTKLFGLIASVQKAGVSREDGGSEHAQVLLVAEPSSRLVAAAVGGDGIVAVNSIQTSIVTTVAEAVCFQVNRLTELLSIHAKEEALVEKTSDNRLRVKIGRTISTIALGDASIYPVQAITGYNMVGGTSIPAWELFDALNQVGIACAVDDGAKSNPALSGIHIVSRGGEIVFEANDRMRAAHKTVLVNGMTETFDFVLPRRAAVLLCDFLSGKREDVVSMSVSGARVVFGCLGYRLSTSLIDMPYPDLSRIVMDYSSSIRVNVGEMVAAIRMVRVMARSDDNTISIRPIDGEEGQGISVSSESSESGDAIFDLSVENSGNPPSFLADSKYLLEMLNLLPKDSSVIVSLTAANKPIRVMREDSSDFMYIVMPRVK